MPELLPADRVRLLADLDRRAPAFTPEWTNRRPADDAGAALRQLFGEQLEAVTQRLDQWPDKALIEFLTIAGVTPLPAVPAEVLLEFQVADDAPQSLLIGAGFQVGGRPPGAEQLVVFETEQSFYAAPGKTGEVFTVDGGNYDPVDPGGPFAPFGDGRSSTAALVIGLTGDAAPTQTLTLGIGVAAPAGTPPPVGSGGVLPLPVPPGPALVWEIIDGGNAVALEVVRDETGGLIRSGLVELALPGQWRPGLPPGLASAKSPRFLRLRVAYGRFTKPPQLSFVTVNMARAVGARTVLDEVPTPVPNTNGRRLRLTQTPLVAGSLILEVEDNGLQVAATTGAALSASGRTRWTAVPDLSVHGPDDAVFEIDLVTGELFFGDGRHGRALPDGYRNVHAVSYQVQSLSPGPVDAGEISTVVTAMEFLGKVVNPLRAGGGGPGETAAQAIKRGPLEIRTRNRAVAVADYALLALRAEGADVARAFAVAGLHPQYPGHPIPGVVGVFVVPPDRGEGQPTPDSETLRAVATHLARDAAPAGVDVVAAAPRYQAVRIDAGIVLEPGADAGTTVRAVLQALDTYLHPLTGGEAGEGWPFGGVIRFVPLLRRISLVGGVHAVPRLNVVLDGIRALACTDVPILPYALLWPSGHQVFISDDGSTS
ncbi:putative baseplate assembly protein [Paraburkholderia ultramafica]|uniref:putative baseplate assembly protein n=1 Tax=Paraburkholderia ultramafica TaxID=1544867 RepID=UPI001582D12C|nr:putative baseplate assembly protein [Paraburkholderia ultramafica]